MGPQCGYDNGMNKDRFLFDIIKTLKYSICQKRNILLDSIEELVTSKQLGILYLFIFEDTEYYGSFFSKFLCLISIFCFEYF